MQHHENLQPVREGLIRMVGSPLLRQRCGGRPGHAGHRLQIVNTPATSAGQPKRPRGVIGVALARHFELVGAARRAGPRKNRGSIRDSGVSTCATR